MNPIGFSALQQASRPAGAVGIETQICLRYIHWMYSEYTNCDTYVTELMLDLTVTVSRAKSSKLHQGYLSTCHYCLLNIFILRFVRVVPCYVSLITLFMPV